ncbi:MAG TPA: hypothetical protein VK700_00745 [Steroidobacteraceae bacterium]|jgi:hypothetical protein|nr:hypothetical protein [Steroidobacteraceae bacterium]
MRKSVLTAFLFIALSACTRSITITLPQQTVTVMAYADGKVVQRCGFRSGTEKFRKLSELLAQHSGGWHKRYTNYVPSLLVVDGDVSLYFMDGSMVVNYSEGEFSRGVSSDDYQFLNCKAP